jgi:hypothetical protein
MTISINGILDKVMRFGKFMGLEFRFSLWGQVLLPQVFSALVVDFTGFFSKF